MDKGDIGRVGCPSAVRPADDVELRGLRAERFFRGKDVLDIGTGDGRLVWLIAPMARSVVGLDPDPAALAVARRKASRRRLAVEWRQGFAGQLPLADQSVDHVLSAFMFHHLDAGQKPAALLEAQQCTLDSAGQEAPAWSAKRELRC